VGELAIRDATIVIEIPIMVLGVMNGSVQPLSPMRTTMSYSSGFTG
jgi:hypothetical protein